MTVRHTTNTHDRVRVEVDPRLEATESGLSRILLGIEPVENLASYIRLLQCARSHLRSE